MTYRLLLPFFLLALVLPATALARVTPDDIYQSKRTAFEASLTKISDPVKREAIRQADGMLNQVNQTVSGRFDVDLAKLSAILEEEKSRQKVTKTVVAYGRGSTPLDAAAYYLNYAEEAVAYQKSRDYTPQIYGNNLSGAVAASINNLQADLQTLQGKVLRAKTEIKKAVDFYE